MAGPGKQYVIGKGKVYFDQFPPGTKTGTGERYVGNSPQLSFSQNQDTLDHFDADQGLNVKDEQVTITNELTGTLQLDSIEIENVQLWFGADYDKMAVLAATAVIDPLVTAVKNRWYQLGTSEDTPSGTRKVTNVVISKQVAAVPPATEPTYTPFTSTEMTNNFEIDLERGRVYIESDAPDITADMVIQFTYDQEAYAREIIVSKGSEVRGALRFIADNPIGENKDYFIPYVKLSANGDYALKGDDWQSMTFDMEVLKKDNVTERLYIDGQPSTTP